jgi:hypothetical protein
VRPSSTWATLARIMTRLFSYLGVHVDYLYKGIHVGRGNNSPACAPVTIWLQPVPFSINPHSQPLTLQLIQFDADVWKYSEFESKRRLIGQEGTLPPSICTHAIICENSCPESRFLYGLFCVFDIVSNRGGNSCPCAALNFGLDIYVTEILHYGLGGV